jgi:hypothetical protein
MSQCPKIDGKYTPLRANQWTKQYQWIAHTMDNLMILFQCWAGSADNNMIFCWWTMKTIAYEEMDG